jgi:hypothetical protein
MPIIATAHPVGPVPLAQDDTLAFTGVNAAGGLGDTYRIAAFQAYLTDLRQRLEAAAPPGWQLAPAASSPLTLVDMALTMLGEALTTGAAYHTDTDAQDLAEYKAEQAAAYDANPAYLLTQSALDKLRDDEFRAGVRVGAELHSGDAE